MIKIVDSAYTRRRNWLVLLSVLPWYLGLLAMVSFIAADLRYFRAPPYLSLSFVVAVYLAGIGIVVSMISVVATVCVGALYQFRFGLVVALCLAISFPVLCLFLYHPPTAGSFIVVVTFTALGWWFAIFLIRVR
ncbi:MAG: hypothetical protein V4738_01075 [Pseudomonadota bacterium]